MPLALKHDQLPLDLCTLRAGEITSAILAYLSHHGFTFWCQDTTGIYNQTLGRWQVNPLARNTQYHRFPITWSRILTTSSFSDAVSTTCTLGLKGQQQHVREEPELVFNKNRIIVFYLYYKNIILFPISIISLSITSPFLYKPIA
jgi:hypothetical protein